jgi:HEPN domain-containing protein
MEDKIENIDRIVNYWKNSSEQNYQTMKNLLKSKDYNWALFLGHLVLEKLLKALYVKIHQKHSVFTHDLLRLSKKIELKTSKDQEEWLDEISTFNINARYDNYKQDFQRLCDENFTLFWVEKIENLRQWLIRQL